MLAHTALYNANKHTTKNAQTAFQRMQKVETQTQGKLCLSFCEPTLN